MNEPMTAEDAGLAMRSRRYDILRDWEQHVRGIAVFRRLAAGELRDAIPELLDEIAEACDAIIAGRAVDIDPDVTEAHAKHRLEEGVDLRDLVTEYSLLRESIVRVLSGAAAGVLEIVHRAIDHAIARSVDRFARARERTMRALDRISSAALASASLDELLDALLNAMLETTPAVNTAAVLLRDGDLLRVRAVAGLGCERDVGFALRVGDGFAGTIAATGAPLLVRHAAADPLVKDPMLRQGGLRALYGVPLVHEGRVIGVAHVGSRTSFELSNEDRRIVAAMAERATSAIARQALAAELDDQRRRSDATLSELARERARFTQVLEELPVAVFLADAPSRQIAYGNRAARNLDGTARAESPELRSWPLRTLAGEPLSADRRPFARVLRGETLREEPIVLATERGDRVLSVSAEPIRDADGQIREAVLVANDLTELHRVIAERDARIEGERAAREEAQRASRLREEVLAVVSHDLRNPIGAVVLGVDAAETALSRGDAARAIDAMERLRRTAKRMDALVGDVLDAARVEARTLPLDLAVVPGAKLADDAVDAQIPLAAERGLELRCEVETEAEVRCDPKRVAQALANILGNALKFTPRGGHVVVAVRERGGELELSVADDGPGIDEALLPKVFDRYWSAEGNGRTGTGLGLYIAKGIVNAHGGRIEVESARGRGTTFRFTLPRA